MHQKALGTSADEVVFDLEDAVAPETRQEARGVIAATLAMPEWGLRTVAVRVNAPGSSELDADLTMVAALAATRNLTVVVPKVEAPAQLSEVAERLGPAIGLQALIETPPGIEAAAEIAAAPVSLQALILGYADLATALGRRGAERHVERWLYHQDLVLTAARAAGAQAIDGPFLRLGEPLLLARTARAVRELGFDGKWAIHPEQVEPLNAAFATSQTELQWASAVEEALEAVAQSGDAAARVDGAMVDQAMRAHAERLLSLPRRSTAPPRAFAGPAHYEDLTVGQVFRAPGLTLTEGATALHQAIVGDRLRLALDAPLSREVTGASTPLVHPMLVCDVAIGQSTQPSGRVLGNLFYKGLAARPVHQGATLRTTTTVVAKRRASSSRTLRGMVLLRVTAVDDVGQEVLDFHRCPLLPREDPIRVKRATISRRSPRPARRATPVNWCPHIGSSTVCGASCLGRCTKTFTRT